MRFTDLLGTLIGVTAYLAGIALAKGFWTTLAAVCLAPFAWYLVVARWVSYW